MNTNIIRYGMILCGMVNIVAILFFSMFFTNPNISKFQPEVMSNFGLFIIIVWGLVFIAPASKIEFVPNLLLAFVFQKLTYTLVWLFWWKDNYAAFDFQFKQDILASAFQVLYGMNDFIWFVFFLWAYLKLRKN